MLSTMPGCERSNAGRTAKTTPQWDSARLARSATSVAKSRTLSVTTTRPSSWARRLADPRVLDEVHCRGRVPGRGRVARVPQREGVDLSGKQQTKTALEFFSKELEGAASEAQDQLSLDEAQMLMPVSVA